MDAGDDAGASNGELEETDYQGYSTPSGSDTSDTTTTYGAWPINDSGHQYNDLKHLWEHHVPRQLPPDAFSPGLRGGPQWVGGTWRLAAWEDLTLPEQAVDTMRRESEYNRDWPWPEYLRDKNNVPTHLDSAPVGRDRHAPEGRWYEAAAAAWAVG